MNRIQWSRCSITKAFDWRNSKTNERNDNGSVLWIFQIDTLLNAGSPTSVRCSQQWGMNPPCREELACVEIDVPCNGTNETAKALFSTKQRETVHRISIHNAANITYDKVLASKFVRFAHLTVVRQLFSAWNQKTFICCPKTSIWQFHCCSIKLAKLAKSRNANGKKRRRVSTLLISFVV